MAKQFLKMTIFIGLHAESCKCYNDSEVAGSILSFANEFDDSLSKEIREAALCLRGVRTYGRKI